MVKISIPLFLLTLLLSSCVSIDKENFTNYFERDDNSYKNLKTDGFYCLIDSVERNKENLKIYRAIVFYKNGIVFGDFNYPELTSEAFLTNDKNKCKIYKNKLGVNSKKQELFSWGSSKIEGDSISLQWPSVYGGNFYLSVYKIVEKKGLIINDSTILLTWFKDENNDVFKINETFRFVPCMPKPDSTNWMMEDRRLNNLLEEYRGDQELNN